MTMRNRGTRLHPAQRLGGLILIGLFAIVPRAAAQDRSSQAPTKDDGIPIESELVRAKCGGCHKPDEQHRMSSHLVSAGQSRASAHDRAHGEHQSHLGDGRRARGIIEVSDHQVSPQSPAGAVHTNGA